MRGAEESAPPKDRPVQGQQQRPVILLAALGRFAGLFVGDLSLTDSRQDGGRVDRRRSDFLLTHGVRLAPLLFLFLFAERLLVDRSRRCCSLRLEVDRPLRRWDALIEVVLKLAPRAGTGEVRAATLQLDEQKAAEHAP